MFRSLLLLYISLSSCSPTPSETNTVNSSNKEIKNHNQTNEITDFSIINPRGATVETRFNTPKGFKRIPISNTSFGSFLRNHPLLPIEAKVKYYDGSTKTNNGVYCSVVDQKISARDLQQCVDAVMRMRGEYLFSQQKYDDIHFNFLSDGKPRYYKDYTNELENYNKFLKYMDWIFAFANTESFEKEMIKKDLNNIEPGDVFLQVNKGTFGHAVLVMDVAINADGERKFILAQSYMPAQETQILTSNSDDSPWYSNLNQVIDTPEWTFHATHLMTFPNK